jgi:hypothetical protein
MAKNWDRLNSERCGNFNLWHNCIDDKTKDLLTQYNKRYFRKGIDPPLPATARLEGIETIAREMQKAPEMSNHMRAD